jgi:hypothetical protein
VFAAPGAGHGRRPSGRPLFARPSARLRRRCAGVSAVSSSSDSARRVAAIGDELGAHKEAASFRQQKRHGMGDFVRCTQTTDRMQANGLLEGRFIQEIQDGRTHVTGMNRIDPDSLGRIGQSLPSGSARSQPCLAATYAGFAASPTTPRIEETLTMAPPPERRMAGI